MIDIFRRWFYTWFADEEAVYLFVVLLGGLLLVVFFGDMLAPVLTGLVLAYLMQGVVTTLQDRGLNHFLSVLAVFLLFLGGLVAVLGNTGHNFGAGMTGGFAYVLDQNNTFVDKYNHELVEIQRISREDMEAHRNHLRGVIREHISETGSAWAEHLLEDFDDYISRFWLVKPKAANLRSLLASTRARPE